MLMILRKFSERLVKTWNTWAVWQSHLLHQGNQRS